MGKLYQIFLSSTYEDLENERSEISDILRGLKFIVAGMENFPSSHLSKWDYMKKQIDESDYFLLISAGRYGEIVKNNKSYSELEYRYALKTNKPILVMLHNDLSIIAQEKLESNSENRERLNNFRAELSKNRLVKPWKTQSELLAGVTQSVIQLTDEFPDFGWIRVKDINKVERIIQLEEEKNDLEAELKIVKSAGLSNGVIEFYNEIKWKNLFETSKNIDLLFAYAQTWRQNNVVELKQFVTFEGHNIRVLLPDPNYELAIQIIALRSGKSENNIKELIADAVKQFYDLKESSRCRACVQVKYLQFIPLYGWFSFDQHSVLTLHSHREGRHGNPTFLLQDGRITRHLKNEFEILFNSKKTREA